MIQVTIPGRDPLQIEHLVLRVDGTLALDGQVLPGVGERLGQLADYVEIHLLTADTYGTQAAVEAELGTPGNDYPARRDRKRRLCSDPGGRSCGGDWQRTGRHPHA